MLPEVRAPLHTLEAIGQLAVLQESIASDALARLAATHDIMRCSRKVEADYVAQARSANATWAEIAAALGVTSSAVIQRFGSRKSKG